MLNGPGDGTKPLTEINNGIFRDYVQAWVAASFENSFSTPEVVINGGESHKKFWMRPKFPDGNGKNLIGYHVAAKLNGGTFHETLSVDKNYTDDGSAYDFLQSPHSRDRIYYGKRIEKQTNSKTL